MRTDAKYIIMLTVKRHDLGMLIGRHVEVVRVDNTFQCLIQWGGGDTGILVLEKFKNLLQI